MLVQRASLPATRSFALRFQRTRLSDLETRAGRERVYRARGARPRRTRTVSRKRELQAPPEELGAGEPARAKERCAEERLLEVLGARVCSRPCKRTEMRGDHEVDFFAVGVG